jgi:hypothetical protein
MFNEDEVIDITNWNFSSEFLQGTRHPKGLQDKHILINPQNRKKYFFKDTWRKRENNYQEEAKHQFWYEYIATKIGESMGLNVPQCYIAISSSKQTDFGVGVLSEWYLSPLEQEISGKDILSGRMENYRDGYLSKSENNNKYYTLQNILEHTKDTSPDYLEFWFKLFLFDALIGNTDRHDENWGVIKHTSSTSFTPIYDNGISLGWSLGWREPEQSLESFDFDKFLNGFRYKIRLSEDSSNKIYAKPQYVISHFVSLNLDFKKLGYNFIKSYKHEELDRIIQIIENKLNPQIHENYRLSKMRSKFILDFVTHRYKKLMELVK